MRLFDAHTHIDMKHYQSDREKVIQRAKAAGVVGMVTSSIGPGSFRRTLGIIEKHKGFIFHTAGCQVSRLTPDEAEKILALIRKYSGDIVAIGEVGLDYHWVKDVGARKAQEPLFKKFIEAAGSFDLPIVIHSRKAEAEATVILEREFSGRVLMHCYDGPKETTTKIADNGWYITLPANFSRYRNRVSAAQSVPLEQILLETDGPYLSPIEGRNEPANIIYGCQSLAECLDQPVEAIAESITRNAHKFYGL
ncbi:MAG: TatD family deoxyribonuclease [Candidatus Thorarchaeota archaeon]|nr:TatD family deoxyribonuclease [Candidatus Thorarchaeota archaeon]